MIYPVNQNNEFNFILVVRKKLPQDKILNELLNIESDSIENYNKEKAQELISKHLPKINSK